MQACVRCGRLCMQVVQQALHGLRRLGDVLGGVLAPREFVRVASAVVQALADRAVGTVLSSNVSGAIHPSALHTILWGLTSQESILIVQWAAFYICI